MSIITIEILFIFLLTILNGVLAMSEIAVVSARKARLQQWAETGNRKAQLALDVSNSPGDFLSTVQVGITLVGVLAGAFGGATIAQHLAAVIARNPVFAAYAETIAVGLVVIAITYLSLILGELVPKRIALNYPERIATFVARPMRFLSRITSPVVWLLSISTNTLLWLFRVRRTTEPPITEEEIRILIRQGTDAGVIERGEQDIIDRVFRLGARRVSTIMTSRKDLVVLYTTDLPHQVQQKIVGSGHALFPLCEETLDNVLGVIRTQELAAQSFAGKAVDLKAIVRQPLFLPESVQSFKLLEEFKRTGKDTALVLDEHGGLQGLITATDILKALLGEVSYLGTPKAVRQSDGTWLVDGMLPLDEFKDSLKLGHLPEEETRSFETVGGFMMALLGRIPSEGDTINWGRYRFKIIDMDGLRVDKILVTPLAE
ncbi:MAG: HlyC/CorC family transporter [Ignavibacteria bacterium]|nr:HlyC/CorC family transporter [Ignavibacteria bacterium]